MVIAGQDSIDGRPPIVPLVGSSACWLGPSPWPPLLASTLQVPKLSPASTEGKLLVG